MDKVKGGMRSNQRDDYTWGNRKNDEEKVDREHY